MILDFFKNHKESSNEKEEKPNFWISYADVMAGLLLVFILILTVVIIDYNMSLEEQTEALAEQREELEQKEERINELTGLREDIIRALQEEFADSDLDMEIDSETGAIRLPGGVFFDTDSSEVTDEGAEFLAEFVPTYVNILLSEDFREYVSQIIIEGHTDDRGDYMYNLNLSQERAFSVVTKIYSDDFPSFEKKNMLLEYLTANGRSYSQPILDETGEIDRDRSRRVEFKFRLQDQDMIRELEEILGD